MEVLSGEVWNGDSFEEGYVLLDDGNVVEVGYGYCPYESDVEGCIMPGLTDGHTHIGDAGLRLTRQYGLEELVAPPDGIKHRYLRETPDDVIIDDMREYSKRLTSNGVSDFLDFREGGKKGALMLRSACPRATILGRPISPEFDQNEIDSILDIADGIGIPSITDMPHRYIDSIADAVHRRGKILALHVSERVREDIGYVISLQPDLVVHMTQSTENDLKVCADEDVPVVVCTSSNLYFGMTPPIKMMMDCGVSASIGTDNAMLCPHADIFKEFQCFRSVLSAQGGSDDDALSALIAHAWKLLNVKSLIEEQTGSKADLVVFPGSSKMMMSGVPAEPVRYGP